MARSYSQVEVQVIANSLIGKTFGEINDYNINTVDYTKGSFGQIIENDVYEYDINSFSEPDFLNAGIELKVTPYKINKNGTLSAKERLVLNIINYMEEYKNEFYTSHFWYKNKKLQIVWYLFEEGKKKQDLKITHQKLFEFPQEDLKIIKQDWEYIIKKIKTGKAHELSEGDTMYLGACTKGVNKESVRKQPFSNIMAKQRAFCLKSSYMTTLVRKYIGNYEDVERVLKNNANTFEQFINNIVDKYKGKSQEELIEIFNINTTAKNVNSIIISRMFGVKGKLSETDEFIKANIIPRTIRIEENGQIKESMPFPAFKFIDIFNQTWEESELKELLETTKYMFFVFRNINNKYIFKGIKLWNMPQLIIDNDIKAMWIKTYNTIKDGNIIKAIDLNGNRITNFPGIAENKICHVRPHARDSNDTYSLPVKDKLTGVLEYTKQSFWINNKYLKEILSDFIN